jgi:hypothetical protein
MQNNVLYTVYNGESRGVDRGMGRGREGGGGGDIEEWEMDCVDSILSFNLTMRYEHCK